jgi:hypothetical protein
MYVIALQAILPQLPVVCCRRRKTKLKDTTLFIFLKKKMNGIQMPSNPTTLTLYLTSRMPFAFTVASTLAEYQTDATLANM